MANRALPTVCRTKSRRLSEVVMVPSKSKAAKTRLSCIGRSVAPSDKVVRWYQGYTVKHRGRHRERYRATSTRRMPPAGLRW
jgi:hypothetical protein